MIDKERNELALYEEEETHRGSVLLRTAKDSEQFFSCIVDDT